MFTSATSRFYLFKFDGKITEDFFNEREKTINKIKFSASNGKIVKLSLTHSRTKIYTIKGYKKDIILPFPMFFALDMRVKSPHAISHACA